MRDFGGRWRRSGFGTKLGAAIALTALAHGLMFGHGLGAGLAGFAFAWLALTIATRPAILHDRRARHAAVAAGLCVLMLADRATLIAWCLFWTALMLAVLSPRARRRLDAWAWTRRILVHAVRSLGAPIADLLRLRPLAPRYGPFVRRWARTLILPLFGGALFLWLFSLANPLIGGALSGLRLPGLDVMATVRVLFWLLVFFTVWQAFRPVRRPKALRRPSAGDARAWIGQALDRRLGSVVPALIVFNALFALENGLDLAFLWSGARLPPGLTLAEYAHRGAYPLIFTALLAAAFSLFVLREGSPGAKQPSVRRLVGLWVAQNVFLSASSLLRTLDYVQAYSLTRLRLAALLWMGLVMLGLALIGWRMLCGKSARLLINANALALVIVLVIADLADLGSVAAWWNVRHAREVGGQGASLDVCYLDRLGPAALLPMIEIEQRRISPALRGEVQFTRDWMLKRLALNQADWRSWSARGALRLAIARSELGHLRHDLPIQPASSSCDPDDPAPSAASPASTPAPPPTPALTPGAKP